MDAINSVIVLLNHWGRVFCDCGGRIFIQSSILVGLLLMVDLCLRTRVCARFRYGIWLLVLVKLALPPSLALPTGVNYWLGRYLPATSAAPIVSPIPVPLTIPAISAAAPASVSSGAAAARTTKASVPHREIVPLRQSGGLLLGWSAGVALLLIVVLRRIAAVRRSLRRSLPAEPQMTALLEECCARLRITTHVTLRLSGDMHSPCVCGFARPVILLPSSLPPGLGSEGLRTILTHELAHVKRWDPWVSLAQTVLQIAYFWHPLVWLANTKLRDLREFAVDETVITTLRSQAQCYPHTLIDIAQMAFRKPALSLRLIGIAESKRALERRIKHMLNRRESNHTTLGPVGLLVILAIGAVLIPMGRGNFTAHAQQARVQAAPALPAGIAELFGLSKDSILEKFGQPETIFRGDKTFTLDNLPDEYFLVYKDLSFSVSDGTVVGITLLGPSHVFGNGVHVGDSESKVRQAFGPPSEFEEAEPKDFLIYEAIGLIFEINKQSRAVMEINITQDYGDPAQVQAYAHAAEFTAQLPQKLAQLDFDSADLKQVITTFGQPVKYIWGPKTLSPETLPNRFVAVYPGDFHVFMMNDRIVEVRIERGSKYAYAGKLRVGSTLEEALAVLGAPAKTVEGKPIEWSDSENVLFKDIDGQKGHCYYHRPDQSVRVWFADYKVAAIYMTRSDYGDDGPKTASDPEFARLLPERVAALNIDSAGPKEIKAIFGEPVRYLWGDATYTADALPDRYIMSYPCGFSVFMMDNRIVEIRHERGSPYVYRDKLRIGSTLEEVLDLLGAPTETVTGKQNTFKGNILFKDIEGQTGRDYYARPDQNVRIFLMGDKVTAIYMTRSDYSDGGAEPFDAGFAALLADRVTRLNIDSAGPDQVRMIFGEPSRYVWGNRTFTADALPDNYIMSYPCSFNVWIQKGRIMEIRHERASPYVYRGKLRIGSTMDEAVALMGAPTDTVTGQKNEFKDGVLYRDVNGNDGQGYYCRSDQKVRVFFWEGKVVAIYMTRGDFPAK